ncbi:MAG TPA: hypothetical protein VHA78_04745 [Candidatus Peribacteraceae bacterium]|nr:hypothetical protein [Candidatus Peribacteraceae bacterium]
MPEEKKPEEKKEKKEPVVKDSFTDDVAYVARETLSPTADPKKDPVPGEEQGGG